MQRNIKKKSGENQLKDTKLNNVTESMAKSIKSEIW